MTSIFRTLPFFPAGIGRPAWAALLASVLVLLTGCASPNASSRDPFESFNRKMMSFNDGIDSVALKPAATAYKAALPPIARTGVSNFFANLGDGWSAINSALQFKFGHAAENFMRLNVNTFFGLGGILDIASELNIERHKEDFGQTLGTWGVPTGPYLVLPFVGPSTMRDAIALPFDRKADPVAMVNPWGTRYSLYTLRVIDSRSNLLRVGTVIDEAALDKYTFYRDAHLQRRRAEISEKTSDGDAGQEPKADGTPAAPGIAPAPASPASAPAPK
ncbi:MAG: VacJ family lipoprotein [Pseudomonadota bacterium]